MSDIERVPTVGEVFVIGRERIIPTYVRLAETPRANGACVTSPEGGVDAAGWYVEWYYEGEDDHPTNRRRRFVPFSGEASDE